MSQKAKTRFTFIDTVVEAGSLNFLIGSRLNNAYDINSSSIYLKFSMDAAKHFVLIESGKRMHSTRFMRETKARQSSFVVKVSLLHHYSFTVHSLFCRYAKYSELRKLNKFYSLELIALSVLYSDRVSIGIILSQNYMLLVILS